MRARLAPLVLAGLLLTSCGGDSDSEPVESPAPTESESAAAASGVVLVSPEEAAATLEDPPDGTVVLDVRTPEEFSEGHLADAELLDIYEPTFADELAELDRDVPYVVYCRSGNRSAQATALMDELGFGAVQEVDGGVVAWQEAGLPLVTGS